MTVIAIRDGIVAADSQLSQNGRLVASMRKVVRLKTGHIAGAGGRADGIGAFLQWAEQGGEFPNVGDEDIDAFITTDDPCAITCYERHAMAYTVTGPFFAFGSGQPVALGAMAAGASAEEAVHIACRYAHGCGGEVVVMEAVPAKRRSRLNRKEPA